MKLPTTGHRIVTAVAAVCTVGMLSGCQLFDDDTDVPVASVVSEPTTAAPGQAPQYDPEGSAADNQPYFDSLLAPLDPESGIPQTQQLVDAVIDGGFPADAIQVTADTTPTELDADSIVISVQIEDECIIGQFVKGYRSMVADTVNGSCLIGQTVDLTEGTGEESEEDKQSDG